MVPENEFGIARVLREQNTVIVEGRCFNGKIGIGTEFRSLSQAIVEKTQVGYQSVGRMPIASIKLIVIKIEAYKRELAEIDSGLTARLTLSGVGADELKEQTVLGTNETLT